MRSSTSTKTSPYQQWLLRVQRVATAYHAGRITPADLPHYQRYILETGEFNACFTVDELDYLHYPKSPFHVKHRHSYIRGTETWATEILRQLYLKEHQSALHDQPVFIDSDEFWSSLPKDTSIAHSHELLAKERKTETLRFIAANHNSDIWVCVADGHGKGVVAASIRKLVVEHAISANVPDTLHAPFTRSVHQYTAAEKAELDQFLKTEVAYYKTLEQERQHKNQQPLQEKEKRDLNWFGAIFGKLRTYQPDFLIKNQIKNHKALRQFAEANDTKLLFDEIYALLPIEAAKEVKIVDDSNTYAQAIQAWINDQTKTRLARIFYYRIPPAKFMGLDMLVLLGHKEAETSDGFGPKSLINRLGYRVDPARALTAILARFPLLFIDQAQTRECWDLLLETQMLSQLPAEREAISDLFNAMFNHKPSDKRTHFSLLCAQINDHDFEGIFKLYADFIRQYLSDFNATHPEGSVAYDVLMPELAQAIGDFVDALLAGEQPDLKSGVRAVQTIAEILRVDLNLKPMAEDQLLPTVIKSKLLKDFPVQAVDMTSYGMRSYLRVIQASRLATDGNHQAKIVVTNQNYFEWILHLHHINAGDAKVEHIRQLEDIDRSADYIFAEIHPNNATEKSLFSQNLIEFLQRMHKENWADKKRTLVFDATLNALDGDEMYQVLAAAKPLVDAGKLNIIIMQSLTKFSQLGLDERAGGLSIVINDGKSWSAHNANYRAIAKRETPDSSTLQFFSYFFNQGRQYQTSASLTLKYMNMIHISTMLLYQEILERLRSTGFENQKYFQMTTNTDGKTCYLSFNTAGILTAFNHDFTLTSADIEQFSTSILEELLVPMCRNHHLPLTRRMSIAFPLSSVNVAIDSIRFTVGIESLPHLKLYAKVIAYIAHAINFTLNIQTLFEKNAAGKYEQRSKIFEEIADGSHLPTLIKLAGFRRIPQRNLYGPYPCHGTNIYILHDGNEMTCYTTDGRKFDHPRIAILEANIATQVTALSAEHLDFFLRGAGLAKRASVDTKLLARLHIQDMIDTHYVPLTSDRTAFHFTKEGIALEKDYNAVVKHGMVITKRVFTSKLTVVEMKYWQEKDVAIARFITFAIAQYVRIKFGCTFKARGDKHTCGSMYQQFLFDMNFDDVGLYFHEAVNVVMNNKAALLDALQAHLQLKQPVKPFIETTNTPFNTQVDTSIFDGASPLDHPAMVAMITKVLKLDTPKSTHRTPLIKRGFFLANERTASSTDGNKPGLLDRSTPK